MEKINEANQRKAHSVKSNSMNKSNNSLSLSTLNLNLDDNDIDDNLLYTDQDSGQLIKSNGNNSRVYIANDVMNDISTTLHQLTGILLLFNLIDKIF